MSVIGLRLGLGLRISDLGVCWVRFCCVIGSYNYNRHITPLSFTQTHARARTRTNIPPKFENPHHNPRPSHTHTHTHTYTQARTHLTQIQKSTPQHQNTVTSKPHNVSVSSYHHRRHLPALAPSYHVLDVDIGFATEQ